MPSPVPTRRPQLEVNSYDIYAKCNGHPMDGIETMIHNLQAPLQATPHPIDMTITVCHNWTELVSYFNVPEVRSAMHTKTQIHSWNNIALVASNVNFPFMLPNATKEEVAAITKNKLLDYKMTANGIVTPLWKYLLDNGIQGLIYHGDIGMACDFIGGLWAVESLQLPRHRERARWTIGGANDDDQTAGFVEDFGMIKYVTVRGSGHMVPTDKPAAAKAMLDKFILH